MAITRPCPKCQAPLTIPEPIPEKIQCGKCAAVIAFKKPAAPGSEKKSSPDIALTKPASAAAPAASPEPEPAPLQLLDEPAPAAPLSPPAAAAPAAPKRAAAGGVLTVIHTIIPKPVLFGIYGALGGFVGVLLFGQILFWFLQPKFETFDKLTLAVSSELVVYPGVKNGVKVKIVRNDFQGAVRIDVKAPNDLDVASDLVIPADETEANLTIQATPRAEVDAEHSVVVTARAADDERVQSTPATIKVFVQPTPPALRLTSSPRVTVYAGGQNRFSFKIARDRFQGPVRVELLDLPEKVHSPQVIVGENQSDGVMTVSLERDALGKENKARFVNLPVEVRSLRDHRIVFRETTVQLNLEPPPDKLQIAAPAGVTVYPGTTNKFFVRISRQEFKGPVAVELAGGPRSVSFTRDIVIPADKSEAEIEVTAASEVEVGKTDVRVTGRVTVKGEEKTAETKMVLNIAPLPPTIQLAVSPRVPVYPGGKAKFGVKIGRARFNGEVAVSMSVPPPMAAYASILPVKIPANRTEAELEVIVNPGALGIPLKPVTVQAIAQASGVPVPASGTFLLDVLPPPSDLAISVSPEVEVYQAGRCEFTVMAAQSGFIGPVQVNMKNVPPGVSFTPLSTKANKIIVQGRATIDAEPKKYEIEVVGTGPKAPDGKVPTASKTFSLIVKKVDPSLRPPLDIVFVLDITKSLDEQIVGVRDGIGQFVKGLKDRDLEARIGLIGFRDINFDGKDAFEVLKFKGDHFTTDAKLFSAEVGKLKAKGGGDLPESSLDAIDKAASEYPFRKEAKRVFLLITDDKPQTAGNSIKMADVQKTLRDKGIDQVHLIVKSKDLKNYAGLQQVAKGGFFDFDQATGPKGKENFASLLPLLSKEIATTIGAPEPKAKDPGAPESAKQPDAPAGEKTPEPKAEARPTSPAPAVPLPPAASAAGNVPGEDPKAPAAAEASPPASAPPTLQSVQSTGRFRVEHSGRLILASGLWTAALAAGIALTLLAAQKRYLSQAWPTIGEIIKALLAGGGAGLFAGMLSQWLFLQVTTGAVWWDALCRVFGWILLGGLVGAAMGLFVPNMNFKRAVLGGCIGGFIGVLGFLLIDYLVGKFLGQYLSDGIVGFLARQIGALLVGLFIGIMVALAELASRRYWLEVSFGPREVRTVTLGADTVALGGDEKKVSVYVPNAPARALGFRVERNRVLCEDFTSGRTGQAAPGDLHSVAAARVRVCSAGEASPTGATLKLLVTRDVPLMIGMPMTGDDIPGLEPQGADGVVAIVSPRPNNPKVYLLRNRSKQPWTVTEADGKPRKVDPGMSVELTTQCDIDFGQVKATIDPSKDETGIKPGMP